MGILDGLFGGKKKKRVYTENKEEAVKAAEKQEFSSDNYGYKEAVKKVKELKTPGDVKKFTKEDTRTTVIKAADKRIKDLNSPDKPKKKKKSTPGR